MPWRGAGGGLVVSLLPRQEGSGRRKGASGSCEDRHAVCLRSFSVLTKGVPMRSKTGCRLRVLAAALAACTFTAGAYAQTDNEALKQQIDALQRQINELKASMERGAAPAPSPSTPPPATARSTRMPVGADSSVELYGHLDLSIDDITTGLSGKVQDGVAAVGNTILHLAREALGDVVDGKIEVAVKLDVAVGADRHAHAAGGGRRRRRGSRRGA